LHHHGAILLRLTDNTRARRFGPHRRRSLLRRFCHQEM